MYNEEAKKKTSGGVGMQRRETETNIRKISLPRNIKIQIPTMHTTQYQEIK